MRLAFHFAVLATAAAFVPSIASATTFYSNSSTVSYAGYTSTLPTNPPDGPTSPTYDIGTGGVWTGPLAGSSYVSFNPNTSPGGSYTAPNGYYDYKFNLPSTGSGTYQITVLADDTVAVYLDDIFQLIPEGAGPYPKCAVGLPNCITPYTFTFTTPLNTPGGYLDFEVHQANLNATGLDFVGQTVTPEPASFMLLGTGIIGSAGAMLRRFRRA